MSSPHARWHPSGLGRLDSARLLCSSEEATAPIAQHRMTAPAEDGATLPCVLIMQDGVHMLLLTFWVPFAVRSTRR